MICCFCFFKFIFQIVTELATLILVGFFGVFYGMDLPHQSHFTQLFCCLFPQLALQLGARSFTENYDGVPLSNIIAILIIDIFAYALAAWYCNQVKLSLFLYYIYIYWWAS